MNQSVSRPRDVLYWPSSKARETWSGLTPGHGAGRDSRYDMVVEGGKGSMDLFFLGILEHGKEPSMPGPLYTPSPVLMETL